MSADWGSFFNSSGNRSSTDEPNVVAGDDDTEPDQGNVLSHIISQLRPGADLSRVVLPTFILEPRSMLERITNFMAHPETLLPMPTVDDPLERFVSVVKFYLSGWHIKPPGVKKPLNPILGETFTGYWDYPDGTRGYYIAEQTSHHPPKSSYFFMAPEHNIRIDGTLIPRSKFLGNSAGSMMEGIAVLRFLNRGSNKEKGERYILTQPNMYARNILIGKMKYELGDHSYVRCPENNLVADIEFKTKGYFTGAYNQIGGTIKNSETGQVYYELSGYWNKEMFITDVRHRHPYPSPGAAHRTAGRTRVAAAVADYRQGTLRAKPRVATDEKTKIEDRQREEAAKRANDGVEWHPKLFRRVQGGPGGADEGEEDLDWVINAQIDAHNPELATKQILSIAPILEGQTESSQYQIPPRKEGHEAAPPDHNDAAPSAAQPASSGGEKLEEVQRKDTQTSDVDTFVDAKP
ncbi:oxysterol-binding protein [Aspergillus arachidicola]|uniref:Oxysterol-binding protein n=1 Tax=Aspergillus arachidicola TaxID=656916 RepID=A0A2G7EL21_9EURO|nr:oxysterol-binding protein [Aspergillus arachidicola]